MADLEKTIDSTENTEGTTTSGVGDDFSLDFSDSLTQDTSQNEPNLSEDSSSTMNIPSPDLSEETTSPILNEDIPSPDLSEETTSPILNEDIPSPDLSEESTSPILNEETPSPDLSEETTSPILNEETPSPDLSEETTPPILNEETPSPDLSEETTSPILNEETPSPDLSEETTSPILNEETPSVNLTNNEEISNPVDTPVSLEQPTINENPFAENPLAENTANTDSPNQEKNKLTAKEKIAQLVKTHETKAKKSGFIKGILSGVALTIVIVLAGFFFAKDQILDLINKIDGSNQPLSANIVDIINPAEENIDENTDIDENSINEDIDDEEIVTEDEDIYPEIEYTDEEFLDEEYIYDDEVFSDEDIDIENIDEEAYFDEDIQMDDSEESYTITRVDSEEDANRVLPTHCNNLSCYGEYKEFTPCNKFRLDANLNEDSQRILKNGACKYKDPSELVFVEFN